MARHLVYKQKVTLHIPKREQALAYQDRVSDLLQNQLKDSIEAVFDEAFPSGEIVRIDSLQINLGTVSAQNFEQEFKSRFISELAKSLSSKKSGFSNTAGDKNSEVLSSAQSLVNALIFFLEKGYLPWYQTVENKTGWAAAIEDSFSENGYGFFIDWLRENYRQSPVIVQRLVLQFSDKFIGDLLLKIALVFDEPWNLIYADYACFLKIFKQGRRGKRDQQSSSYREPASAFEKKSADAFEAPAGEVNDDAPINQMDTAFHEALIREKIWYYAFHVLLGQSGADAAFDILKLLTGHFEIKAGTIAHADAPGIIKQLKTNTVQSAFKKLVSSVNPREENHEKASTISTAATAENNMPPGNNITVENKSTAEKTGDEKTACDATQPLKDIAVSPAKNKKKDLAAEKDVIYVNNSGIVLLHPFLRRYFEDLGLYADKKFINDDARRRAVLLLHYLATGDTEVAEFDLALQKVLCGYPLEETLPAAIKLSKKEKEESKSLLLSVISHWEPLKTTSVAGLRETFLQRAGKLELKGSGWLLVVEQKTLDILLGKLPWGFSTIRLPWMPEMLSVDWC